MKIFSHIIALLLCFVLTNCTIHAQEIIADVVVTAPNLQTVDPAVFETLEKDIRDFMSSRKWTQDEYGFDERIKCNININITSEITASRFLAEATIQASRPVYNSSYESVIFEHKDNDLEFNYAQFQTLEFDENSYTDNLTSFLGFYANIILAFDYDSFSKEGGTKYFQNAQKIMNNIPNNRATDGWLAFKSTRNRYWMVENYLNPRFRQLRAASYIYHREGLDQMFDNPSVARNKITACLQMVRTIREDNPNTMAIDVFNNSKGDEILDIFNDGSVSSMEKNRIANILDRIDPGRSTRFRTSSGTEGTGINIPMNKSKRGN